MKVISVHEGPWYFMVLGEVYCLEDLGIVKNWSFMLPAFFLINTVRRENETYHYCIIGKNIVARQEALQIFNNFFKNLWLLFPIM